MSDEQAVHDALSAESARVMEQSKPIPSQADIDAIKRGEKGVDDKEDPKNPEMPPAHEQHAAFRQARQSDADRAGRERGGYQTRAAEPEESTPAPAPTSGRSTSRASSSSLSSTSTPDDEKHTA
jgi:hypothetical protein